MSVLGRFTTSRTVGCFLRSGISNLVLNRLRQLLVSKVPPEVLSRSAEFRRYENPGTVFVPGKNTLFRSTVNEQFWCLNISSSSLIQSPCVLPSKNGGKNSSLEGGGGTGTHPCLGFRFLIPASVLRTGLIRFCDVLPNLRNAEADLG
jgi:hypothetical protein